MNTDELSVHSKRSIKAPITLKEKVVADDLTIEADRFDGADFNLEEMEEKLKSLSDTLETGRSSVAKIGKLKAGLTVIGILLLLSTLATVGFILASIFTNEPLRQTMIIGYYFSYTMGTLSMLLVDRFLRTVVNGFGDDNELVKSSPVIRYMGYVVVSPLIAVGLHWLLFWT